jgi:hypothetical protein
MTDADRKLTKQISDWRRICPPNVHDVEDIDDATTSTGQLARVLSALKSQFPRKSREYQKFDAKQISALLQRVQGYQAALTEREQELATLKKWLSRVKAAAEPVPFALVAKGNSQGSLHVYKQEGLVQRSALTGKRDISGSKIFRGTCTYSRGKLVFKFICGARKPWKALLQQILGQADMKKKVLLDGLHDDRSTT